MLEEVNVRKVLLVSFCKVVGGLSEVRWEVFAADCAKVWLITQADV